MLAGQPCPLAAAADAIVVSNAPDDERWRTIVEAHADLHPGVPVCVEPRAGRRPAGQARVAAPEGSAALTLDDDDPRQVVEPVDRLGSLRRPLCPGPSGLAPGAKSGNVTPNPSEPRRPGKGTFGPNAGPPQGTTLTSEVPTPTEVRHARHRSGTQTPRLHHP